MSGEQPGLDYGEPGAAHATIFPVDSPGLALKFERVLLSGMFRHGPAIMCRILVFATNHQWAPDRLDALTDT